MLVLLAEDDEDYAEIIAETLRRDSHEVVVAGSVDGAVRFARQGRPDLAVLDVMLPDGSGLDVGRSLRADRPEVPIIFLSSLDRTSDIVAGFDAGADDYVTKPFHPSEFLARVRAVERRYRMSNTEESLRAPTKLRANGLEFDESNQSAYLDGSNLNCTRLEFEILREMAAVPGQVLSHSFLNERIWSYPNMKDGTLLKGHISSIRRKLKKAGGNEEMIRTVHGVGYAFSPN
jgi:two-component system OmpR family response regulator